MAGIVVLQTVFAQSLTNHGVGQIEHLRAVVLVGAVDAVGPHVNLVAVQSGRGVVVPEV